MAISEEDDLSGWVCFAEGVIGITACIDRHPGIFQRKAHTSYIDGGLLRELTNCRFTMSPTSPEQFCSDGRTLIQGQTRMID